MSEQEPNGPYVYQPFAPVEKHRGRIYGIGGLDWPTRIEGLTKGEAEAICELLRERRKEGL